MQNGEQADVYGRGTQGKRFCFTLNNPSASEIESASGAVLSSAITGLVIGSEGADRTPHLQGYVECARRFRFNGLRKELPFLERAALFVARGTRRQNIEYCQKEGRVLVCLGLPQVSDLCESLDQVKQLIDEGLSEVEIAGRNFSLWARHWRSIERYRFLKEHASRPLWRDVQVFVFYGRTGTGKTKEAYTRDPDLFPLPVGRGFWFDGYVGQRAVLLDDYRGQFPFDDFLRILDVYPVTVPVKGGHVVFRPERIYITSNRRVEEWYPDVPGDEMDALLRRLTEVKEFIKED